MINILCVMKSKTILLIVLMTVSFNGYPQKELNRLMNQSHKAVFKGDYEKVFDLCDKALAIDSMEPRIYYYRGIAYYFNSEPESAVIELFKADTCGCDDPVVDYYLGMAYYDLKDYRKAATYLRSAQEFYTKDMDLLTDLANAYLELGHDSCLYYFDLALAKKSRFSSAYRGKGDFFYEQERYKESIHYYNQAIRFDRRDADSYYLRSYTRYRLADYQGAEEDILKSIELDGGDADKYHYLGIYRYGGRNYPAAKDAFEKSIAINISGWESMFYLAHIQYEEGSYTEALDVINKAIRYNKNNAGLFLLRGYIKYELSDPGDACMDWTIAGGMGSEKARELVVDACENYFSGQ